MTTVDEALQEIREAAPPESRYVEPYRPAYRTLLAELEGLGGEHTVCELVARITDRTRSDGQLPDPASVRMYARTLCAERDIPIPDDSPLREGSANPGVHVDITERPGGLADRTERESE